MDQDTSAYISKCYNKIANLTQQINDPCVRDSTKANLKNWESYWEDELWLALEQKAREDEAKFLEQFPEGYSNRN